MYSPPIQPPGDQAPPRGLQAFQGQDTSLAVCPSQTEYYHAKAPPLPQRPPTLVQRQQQQQQQQHPPSGDPISIVVEEVVSQPSTLSPLKHHSLYRTVWRWAREKRPGALIKTTRSRTAISVDDTRVFALPVSVLALALMAFVLTAAAHRLPFAHVELRPGTRFDGTSFYVGLWALHSAPPAVPPSQASCEVQCEAPHILPVEETDAWQGLGDKLAIRLSLILAVALPAACASLGVLHWCLALWDPTEQALASARELPRGLRWTAHTPSCHRGAFEVERASTGGEGKTYPERGPDTVSPQVMRRPRRVWWYWRDMRLSCARAGQELRFAWGRHPVCAVRLLLRYAICALYGMAVVSLGLWIHSCLRYVRSWSLGSDLCDVFAELLVSLSDEDVALYSRVRLSHAYVAVVTAFVCAVMAFVLGYLRRDWEARWFSLGLLLLPRVPVGRGLAARWKEDAMRR